MAQITVGSIVEYANPYPDEIGTTYKVLEIDRERVLMVYVCDLPIPPSFRENIADLKLVDNI